MKRFALLLLAFAMIFVMASAEEQFVEEDFAAAASFDDEFFAEEEFFGDAFEAEQPEDEEEAEDRSVYLFENEENLRGEPEDLVTWQKWVVKDLKAEEGKKGKVNLYWHIERGGDVAPSMPESTEQPNKKEIKNASGVKVYIYQVDAKTGIPTQVKKVSLAKKKATVTVKTSGTYTWFARLEKVSKDGNEFLGRTSVPTNPLTITTLSKKAVTKVKAFYANASEQPAGQASDQPVVTVSVNVYTKEADASYTIDVAQKKGASGTATYMPADMNKVKAELQGKGYISVNLFDNDEVTWNGAAPKLEANGKKITVSVKSGTGKAKKGSVTPKAISNKTQPVIISAVQVDATHVYVTWFDEADKSKVNPANAYTIAAGKAANKVTVKKADLITNDDGSYSYNYVVKENAKNKAKSIKITVKSEAAKKSKKSKAFKVALYAVPKGAILNLTSKQVGEAVLLTWNTTVSAAYEVFATDSVHSDEVFKNGELLLTPTEQPSEGPEASTYFALFTAEDLAKLSKGYRWSFTVKAVNGTHVIAREVAYIGKDPSNQPDASAQTIIVNKDTTLAKAVKEAKDGDTILLGVNVDLDDLVIVDKDLVVDLNGKKITAPEEAFSVSGNLTLTGKGTITSKKAALAVTDAGHLTVEGGTINAQECGILVYGKGTTVDVNGGIFNVKDNAAIMDNGTAGLSGNTINVTGGTFNCGIETKDFSACGIYAANDNTWNITGGTFNVTNGAGIVARAGTVNVSKDVVINVTGKGTGKVGDHENKVPSAAIVFDSDAKYPGLTDDSSIVITGGTFTSEVAAVQTLPAGEKDRVVISGGSFSSNVSDFCAPGYSAKESDGLWVVQ